MEVAERKGRACEGTGIIDRGFVVMLKIVNVDAALQMQTRRDDLEDYSSMSWSSQFASQRRFPVPAPR
jgi:hypothetical protein